MVIFTSAEIPKFLIVSYGIFTSAEIPKYSNNWTQVPVTM